MNLDLTINYHFGCGRSSMDANTTTTAIINMSTEDPKEIGSVFFLSLK